MTEPTATEHAAHRVNNAAETSTPQCIGFMRQLNVPQDFEHMGAETIATL